MVIPTSGGNQKYEIGSKVIQSNFFIYINKNNDIKKVHL